jgi:NDP-sugar pyrophosphorylase family protein
MLTVAGKPMIDYTVSHLADFGVYDYVFTLAHKPEQIIEWATGYRDVVCHFSLETVPLGTLGGVKAAQKLLDDTFIVMSGDALENINLDAMLNKHRLSGALITIAVKEEDDTGRFGVVEADAYGTVTGFTEKPPVGTAKSKLINCGVDIVEKSVLSFVPDNENYDFARGLFPKIVNTGLISAFIHDGYWRDIGDINSYYSANYDVPDGGFYQPLYNNFRGGYSSYRTGESAGSLIGVTALNAGRLDNCIIGQNCRIERGSALENCVVMPDTYVNGRYKNAVIGGGFVKQIEIPDPVYRYAGAGAAAESARPGYYN